MLQQINLPRSARYVCLLLLVVMLSATFALAASPNIVISQVYGGGGNSGSVLRNDFVELFNRGSAPVDITGWSLQYGSAGGTSIATVHTLSGVIQPGHFYLAVEAKGTGGTTDLPASDATPNPGPLNMGGSAGKVFLVVNATGITLNSSGCPTSAVVDFVGYGPTTAPSGNVNCFEGSSPAGSLSSVNAAVRTDPCSDGDNNSTDFNVTTANPRNSSSSALTCVASTNPSGTGAANPSSVDAGATTLLTVTVAPGGNPTSTGITVTADLTAIGGSATQAFVDDGSNGDATASDGVYSYLATVGAGITPGAKSISAIITDAQSRSGNVSFNVTVNQPPVAATPIHAIQGNGKTSPLVGQTVTTTGIVTAVVTNGFYLQAKDADADADPATSEGIFVYTGSTAVSQAVVGNELSVTGMVSEYPTSSTYPVTEITTPSVTLLTQNNPLPAAVDVPLRADGALDQLEPYEGMLVHFAAPKVIAATGGSSTSDGVFYITGGSVPRPFREPGLMPGTPTITGMPANVPLFDGNPERLRVDTSACGTPVVVAVGDVVPAITGPISYAGGDYTVYPCGYTNTSTAAVTPLPTPAYDEFTIASFNMLNFTSDPTRLAKASKAIRDVMQSPFIIGVEEMKDLSTLQALAAKIGTDGGPSYSAALLGTDGSQNVGVLYRTDRVTVSSVQEVGKTLTMPGSTGSDTPVFDRPPLVVTAQITPPAANSNSQTNATAFQPYPVTVFVNHSRSMIDVEKNDNTGDFVRRKRKLEAEALAGFIKQHQDAGENVISVGDYNAFEFNDGYVDVIGTIIGNPTPSDQVLLSSSDLIDPDLTDLITLMVDNRYTYVESGSAQAIDHIIVTSGVRNHLNHIDVAHNNADFPTTYAGDGTRPERVSDHDIPVAYFAFPPPPTPKPHVTLSATTVAFGDVPVGATAPARNITLTNDGTADLNISTIAIDQSDFSLSHDCGAVVTAGTHCTLSVQFMPPSGTTFNTSITVIDDADDSPQTVAVSGNGVTTTIGLAPNPLNFADQVINTVSSQSTVTLTNTGTKPLYVAMVHVGPLPGTASANISASWPGNVTEECSGKIIAAGGTCPIYATFAPTALGTANGTVVVRGNFSDTILQLSGKGVDASTAVIEVTPTTLDFGSQHINGASTAKAVTIKNTGTGTLTISNITLPAGDFTQTNNCPASLAPNATCTITAAFAPKSLTNPNKSNTITITHNAAGSPSSIALTGMATDFTVAPPSGGSTSSTVKAGQPATFNLQVAGTAGSTGAVTFTCGFGAPAPDKAACTVSPTSATLNGTTPVSFTVTVSTTAATGNTQVATGGFQSTPGPGRGLPFALALSFAGVGAILLVGGRGKRQLRFAGACAALLMVVALSSCGGSKSTPTPTPVPGTAAGTYTVQLIATSGGVNKTTQLTMTVN